jgi:hypothetical protein
MSVFVVSLRDDLFTHAIAAARRFTKDLGSKVTVLAPRVVPYPLDLERPQVSPAFSAHTLPGENVRVVLCRDARAGLIQSLPVRSLVIMGARKRWWKTKEESLAERLRAEGHHVFLAWNPEASQNG